MGDPEDRYRAIDGNIATNIRAYREARGISQEDLAGRLSAIGIPFSQATVWKVENRQRPLKAAELIAVADVLGLRTAMPLTLKPDTASHLIDLQQARARAATAWNMIKDAATDYLEAQIELGITARMARDAGLSVTELEVSWLNVTPEEAVIQARVDSADEETRSEKLNDEVVKILAALRDSGYEPHLSIDDVTYHEGGPLPEWVPGGETAQPIVDEKEQ